MKELKSTLLFAFLFSFGCAKPPSPIPSFSQLKAPIMVVAKSQEGAVTVCDSLNRYLTIGGDYYLAITLSSSYEVGDTILFFSHR